MIDPITVIGLISVIIAIVEETQRLASILVAYNSNSTELKSILSSLTRKLSLLAKTLTKIKQATTEEQIQKQKEVLDECLKRMNDLHSKLENLRPKEDENGFLILISKRRRLRAEPRRIPKIMQLKLDLETLSIRLRPIIS
jgi:hypothetical protein